MADQSKPIAVEEEETTWHPAGILTTRYRLANGMEVLHHVTEGESTLTYQHAEYAPKDMRQHRAAEEQRLAQRADIRPIIAQKVLEYEQKLIDNYEEEEQ